MKVELLSYTPNPEELIARAAKNCYSSSKIEDIMKNMSKEDVDKYIDKLMKLGHQSPLEHVSFTFGIEGISRACTHQLVRHRIASYSQQSQRYVNMDNIEFVIPEIFEDCEDNLEIKSMIAEMKRMYAKAKVIGFKTLLKKDFDIDYEQLYISPEYELEHIYSSYPKEAKKVEKQVFENARAFLPNCCGTQIIVTMNARSLLNFFSLRCCSRAQSEIRAVALEMLSLCKEKAPHIFSNAGPECLRTKCPEGVMTCGKPWKK